MDETDRTREKRVRRAALGQGRTLVKSRRRDLLAADFGKWQINGRRDWITLDQVEHLLGLGLGPSRQSYVRRTRCPQYLCQVADTPDSLAAQMKNPEDRLEVVGKQIDDAASAKIIAGAYGEYDVAIIVEAPDEVSMAAVAIAIAAGGAVKAAKTTPLLSGAQWLAAMGLAPVVSAPYRPAR